jgi:hypothetical protein
VAVVSVLVTASIGAGIGVGVVILVAGVAGRGLVEGSGLPRPASGNRTLVRAATAALTGIVVLAATRWLAAGVLVATAV